MEFADKNTSNPEKCMICLNPAWIKISKIENKERSVKFVCVEHYTALLKQYISGELSDSIILFNPESKMLEIPLYEAMERFGGLDERKLLNRYIEFLEEKITKIEEELTQSNEHFFLALLESEKQDKILKKLLAQARIKQINF